LGIGGVRLLGFCFYDCQSTQRVGLATGGPWASGEFAFGKRYMLAARTTTKNHSGFQSRYKSWGVL